MFLFILKMNVSFQFFSAVRSLASASWAAKKISEELAKEIIIKIKLSKQL